MYVCIYIYISIGLTTQHTTRPEQHHKRPHEEAGCTNSD